jgi:RNA polymerase subunit RPABC4/transcription elongation factor Spt4
MEQGISLPGFLKCMHCGFRLPPNHTGPCPNCGKTGTSAEVFGYSGIGVSAQVQIENAVNSSSANAFASHHRPVPEWWSEASKDIAKTVMPTLQNEVQNQVRIALEQHDMDIEKREKSVRNRLIKVAITIFWILVGIVLTWLLGSRF